MPNIISSMLEAYRNHRHNIPGVYNFAVIIIFVWFTYTYRLNYYQSFRCLSFQFSGCSSTSANFYIFIFPLPKISLFYWLISKTVRNSFSLNHFELAINGQLILLGHCIGPSTGYRNQSAGISAQYLWHSKILCQPKNYYHILWAVRGTVSLELTNISGSADLCEKKS